MINYDYGCLMTKEIENGESVQLTEAERDFVDKLGLQAEQGGMTRATGRIWGLLIVFGEALPPGEIAETLQISRASVSVGLKLLEQFDLLEIRAKPGDRQTYYQIRKHPYSAMIQSLIKQSVGHVAMVRAAQKAIGKTASHDRIDDLAQFYEIMQEGYQVMLDRMDALSNR
jgi:DNA-binding transcriptional regulator GbsR (MarR family)